MALRAPLRRVGHSPWQTAYKGSNHHGGWQIAEAEHAEWLDIDGSRSRDMVLVNDHGRPSIVWTGPKHRLWDFTWAHLKTLVIFEGANQYRLRTIAAAMLENAQHRKKSEVEIKFLGPINDMQLLKIMMQLALDAEKAYGPAWRDHMLVKVLSNLRGGVPYALRVCRAARAACGPGKVGITTMILARGPARFRTFRAHPEVIYVRGSAVIR